MMQEGYLANGAHVVVHLPDGRPGTGVVIVPPFGFEDVSSYRGLRGWAESLARGGHPVLRLGLPGTGDSAGEPGDPELLDTWTSSVGTAADALRAASGCERVAALGLGLGGMIAYRAAARGLAIDELCLWAVPSQGRALLRRIRAFAMLQGSAPPTPQPDGSLWFYGYPMSAATAAELEHLDLTELSVEARVERALVLGPDRMAPDAGLVGGLRGAGVDVTEAAGDGYAELVGNPQTARAPRVVLETLSTWLGGPAGRDDVAASATHPVLHATVDVAPGVRERVLDIATADGRLSAVVTEPTAPTGSTDVCLVLLNAGATRRIGTNRLWVRAARQSAAVGVPAVRVDLVGLGDSAGPDAWTGGDAAFYTENYLGQVTSALDRLTDDGLARRFVVAGLCSGAYWAFRGGQVDPRVRAVVMVNPLALVWDAGRADVVTAQDLRLLRRAATWRRIVTGRASLRHGREVTTAAMRRLLRARSAWQERRNRRSAGGAGTDPLDVAFEALAANDVATTLVFSAGEKLLAELQRDDRLTGLSRWPNVDLHLLDGPTDVHTLAPPALQTTVLALIDDAVGRVARGTVDPPR
jgi:pimeloyl-ACP methyl ester carboxylesterase